MKWPLLFDVYLLHYPEGSSIPPHTDPIPGLKHIRANIEIKKADRGGVLGMDGKAIFSMGRITLFRSDLNSHWVSKIEKGQRKVLSIGLAIRE